MSYAVYVYPDYSGSQEKIRSDELNWTGTWSSTGTYFSATYDAVLYGDDRYITVLDNVGVNPTTRLRNPVRPNPFSLLVVWQAGSEPPFSPPEPPAPTNDMLYAALTAAWAGTAAAYAAQQTAWTGTATADSALATAWAGTSAANSAIASADNALSTAWAGTAAAAGAAATADTALQIAWYGTDLATTALYTAWTGTAGAAAGVSLANSILLTAWAGTAGAASAVDASNAALLVGFSGTAGANAAIDLANQALSRSFAGTSAIDLANQALQTAWVGTAASGIPLAETALQTAWTGTQEATAANDLAYTALQTAWTGTAAITGGTITFDNPTTDIGLSVVNGSGTTAMRSSAAPKLSQAIAPTWSAHHKFRGGLAVPAVTVGPYTLTDPTTYLYTADRSSILIASDDTTAGNRQIALNSGNGDGHLLTIVFSGTGSCEMRNNAVYAGCRVRLQDDWRPVNYSAMALRFDGTDWIELCRTPFASSGTMMAYEALQAAWSGTAAAVAGIDLANAALQVGYTGTASVATGSNMAWTAHIEAGTKLDLAGGTLVGNLVVPNVEVGVGTVPYSTAVGGTIYYDFTGPAYQTTTVREGTLFVSAVNMNAGREIAVLLQQSGTSQTVGYSSSFTWFGTTPPITVYDKNVLIAMTSLGDDLTGVIAAATTAV